MIRFGSSATYEVNLDGIKSTYTVYQDDSDTNLFFIMPNRPKIALNEQNKLSFIYRKYRFADDKKEKAEQQKRLGGGYVAFDVELTVPPEAISQIETQLKATYKDLLAAYSKAKADADANPTDADKRKSSDRLGKRVLGIVPDQIRTGPLQFTDGDVMLGISKEANSDFVQSVLTSGKPAKDGKVTATFVVNLTDTGATFFENAMKGESGGSVAVFYKLRTWVRSSDTEVVASYNKKNALKYTQTITKSSKIWRASEYKNSIQAELLSNQVVNVDVSWGDGEYTEAQKDSIRKWATDSVTAVVAKQIPNFTMPTGQDAEADETTRAQNLTNTEDFTQTYRENFAMLMEFNPQGLLPNIGSMKDPAGGNFKWKDYFDEIDLDDEFFRSLRLNVSTDLSFENSPINRLTVELWYRPTSDGSVKELHETLTFNKDTPTRQGWNPFGTAQSYEYQYQVSFANGAEPFVSQKLSSNTKELTVGRSTEGLISVDVLGNGMSPSLIRQASVELKAIDPTTQKTGPSARAVLDKNKVQERIVLPVGNLFAPPYTYQYTVQYTLEPDGLVMTQPATLSTENTLMLSGPFAQYRKVEVQAQSLKGEDTATVTLVYKQGDFERRLSLTLDADNKVATRAFGVRGSTPGTLTYEGTFDLADGTTLEIPLTEAKTDIIRLNPKAALDTDLTIKVDSTFVSWEPLGRAVLELKFTYGGREQHLTIDSMDLPKTPPKLSWVRIPGVDSYTWQATWKWKPKGGSLKRLDVGPRTSTDTDFTVLAPDELAPST